MSDITYFPTNSTKMWNKRMIETVQALPERFFTETITKLDPVTGKETQVQQKTKLSGRHITKLITARFKLEKWQNKKGSVLSTDAEDYEKGGIVKIKKEKKISD